jgi:hypothetical protein
MGAAAAGWRYVGRQCRFEGTWEEGTVTDVPEHLRATVSGHLTVEEAVVSGCLTDDGVVVVTDRRVVELTERDVEDGEDEAQDLRSTFLTEYVTGVSFEHVEGGSFEPAGARFGAGALFGAVLMTVGVGILPGALRSGAALVAVALLAIGATVLWDARHGREDALLATIELTDGREASYRLPPDAREVTRAISRIAADSSR